MTTANEPRQMTLEEIEKDLSEKAGNDWRVTVRLLPDGHTQIRSTRNPK